MHTKPVHKPIVPRRQDFNRLKLALLSEVELFGNLSGEDIERLIGRSTMIQFPRGRTLVSDELDEVLFILKKGRAQLYRVSPEGRKFVLDTLSPGSVFGECVLTGQRLSGVYIEALEDSVLCVLSRKDVERLVTTTPGFALRLLEILGRRVYELEERLEELALKKVPARVAALLLRLAEKEGNPIVGYTHQDIADMVGAYRETVTQVMNEFKQRGMVRISRKQIHILDEEGLRAIAEG